MNMFILFYFFAIFVSSLFYDFACVVFELENIITIIKSHLLTITVNLIIIFA